MLPNLSPARDFTSQEGEDRTSVTSVFFIIRPDLPAKNDSEDFFNVRLRIAHRDPDSAHVRTTLRRGTSLPLLPAMNSSDSRPTQDTKRPRTDGADDRTRMGNPTPGATSRPRTDDAPDGKDGSPRSLVSGPMCKVSAAQHVNVERHPRESACISLREHLGGREYERCSCLRQS